MFSRGCGYPQGCCKMEIVTLGIYSQKVTIFVLCIVADNQTLVIELNAKNKNLLRCQTPRNAVSAKKFLHALLFSKSGQIKKL